MKQLFLTVFISVVSCLVLQAQHFEGGVLGGLNASQVDGDTHSGYNKPGILAGGFVQLNLNPRLFAGMELRFSQEGSRKNPNPRYSDDRQKYIMRLSYAEMPLYLGYRTNEKTSVLAGLSSGYLISGTEYDNYGKFVREDQHPFKEFDFQGMLGFRVQLNSRLMVDLRGAYSILPIREAPVKAMWSWKHNQHNNLLSTTILYRLDF